MNTPPGMEIFSKEWFDTFLTSCPEVIRPAVERICSGFQLGNTSDPNTVSKMILDGIYEVFKYEYVVEKDGARYAPTSVGFEEHGGFTFFGESDKDSCVFTTDDILQRFPKTE